MEQRAETSPSSPTPSSNISRLGRQITRSILPALRNLVRSHRSSSSSSSSSRVMRQSNDNIESPLNLSSSVPPTLQDITPLSPSPPVASSPLLDTDGWFSDETTDLSSPSTSNTDTSSNVDQPTTTDIVSTEQPTTSLDHERWFEDVPVYQANTTDFLPPLHRLPSILRHAASRQAARNEETMSLADFNRSSPTTDDNDNDNMDVDAGDNTTNLETSGSISSSGEGRQRYRLVVYFEERSQEDHTATARYVAVIVGRLDELQFLLTNANNPERGFTDMLDHLFNAYKPKGTPPASQSSIDSLCSSSINEEGQRCSICLENFEVGYQATQLPCSHRFHGEECVKHWLSMHNSCPVCRYELPVDDQEYEVDRKKRMVERGIENDDDHAQLVDDEDNHHHHHHHQNQNDVGGSADM